MKTKYKLLFFFIFLTNFLLAQDTITVYYDKKWNPISNQQVAVFYRKAYLDSTKMWRVNDYFISGKIQMTGVYTSQKFTIRQGYFIYFLENGNKSSEGNYINDKREGVWVYYYESGEKASIDTYVKDKYNGESTSFFKNGKIKSQGKLVNDKAQGIWKYWYEQGQLQSEENYKDGIVLSAILYFQDGKIQLKGNYVNGKKEGIWTNYGINGRVIYKGQYIKDLREGEWIRYLPDGKEMKVIFKNDLIISEELGSTVISE